VARRVDDVQKLVTEVRRFRSDQGLKPGQRVPARLSGGGLDDLAGHEHAVRSLAKLAEPGESFGASASVEVGLSGGPVVVELDLSGAIDVAAERKRLDKDLAAARKELAQADNKLANPSFLAKAPEAVVTKIRDRRQVAEADIERITARLEALPTA
jgi:valyl-tRNA synthetase